MILGTATISGDWPLELDGLQMGYHRLTRRFKITDAGLQRGHKLYKTFDPQHLADVLGVLNARVSVKMRVPN